MMKTRTGKTVKAMRCEAHVHGDQYAQHKTRETTKNKVEMREETRFEAHVHGGEAEKANLEARPLGVGLQLHITCLPCDANAGSPSCFPPTRRKLFSS